MSWDSIDSIFKKQYSEVYLALVEQKESKLLGTIKSIGEVKGESFSLNEMSSLGDTLSTPTRFGEATYTDVSFASRVAPMTNFDNFTRVDINDFYKLAAQPTDEVIQRLHARWNRHVDRTIYNGLIGTAQRKENGTNVYTNVALPADQILGDDLVAFNKELLISIKTAFDENEVEEPITILYNAAMINAILSDPTLSSADYNSYKPLADGTIKDFMGMNWIKYQGIQAGKSATKALGVAYTSDALQYGSNVVSPFKMVEREDWGRALSLGEKRATGCVRTDEKKVVAFKFKV